MTPEERRQFDIDIMGEAWVLEAERRERARAAAEPLYEQIRAVVDPAQSNQFVARCGSAVWERLKGLTPGPDPAPDFYFWAVATPWGTVRCELAPDADPEMFEVVPR